MTGNITLDKLPLILIPRSLPSDELLRFIYLILDNKFPFAKLVVEKYQQAELIISHKERYIHLANVEEYIKNTCSCPPRNATPCGHAPQNT